MKINRDIAKQDEFTKSLAHFENELTSSQSNPPKTVEQYEVILQEYVEKSLAIFRK